MVSHKVWKYYVPLIAFVVIFGFLWRGLSLNPRQLPSALIDKPAPAFALPDLFVPDKKIDQRVLLGSISVVNVWASWCDSCAEEQAFLLTLKARYPKLQLIGLAFQDQPDPARHWLKQHGNPYDRVMVDEAGRVGVDYGVYGTPETFLIDAKGVIRAKLAGTLTESGWQQLLRDAGLALAEPKT